MLSTVCCILSITNMLSTVCCVLHAVLQTCQVLYVVCCMLSVPEHPIEFQDSQEQIWYSHNGRHVFFGMFILCFLSH